MHLQIQVKNLEIRNKTQTHDNVGFDLKLRSTTNFRIKPYGQQFSPNSNADEEFINGNPDNVVTVRSPEIRVTVKARK